MGKVSHFALFGQTQFTQLTAAIILRSLLFFDYEQSYPPHPALSPQFDPIPCTFAAAVPNRITWPATKGEASLVIIYGSSA